MKGRVATVMMVVVVEEEEEKQEEEEEEEEEDDKEEVEEEVCTFLPGMSVRTKTSMWKEQPLSCFGPSTSS